MSPTHRKQAQLKLEVLYQRKAKAEAMGPDVIQAHRAAYDQICADIAELEDALALDAGSGIKDALALIREICRMGWPPGGFDRALTVPGAEARLAAAEDRVIAAYHRSPAAGRQALTEDYLEAIVAIQQVATMPPEQVEFKEVLDDGCPWR